MERKDRLFWVWLSLTLGAASRDFKRLVELYESPYDMFLADDGELERIRNLSPHTRAALADKNLQRATDVLNTCEQQGIGILTFEDTSYPAALREIKNPPVLLYYSGALPPFDDQLCIGMVGTRRMSAYGMQTAYKISYELTCAGAIVVSGMAAGIDGVCAAAAIAAKGTTVAVLGCGLDVVYPRHHKQLMEEIRRSGVLLSEYPPGTRPNHYHFPVRNRIISGLSQGTVVVEAGVGSGSLITAKEAVLQGRDIFALPANVGSRGAEGTNGLLRDGAIPVLEATDILKPYHFLYADTLHPEAAVTAAEKSRADLRYLEQMGVIELTRQASDTHTSNVRAANPPAETEKTVKPRRTAAKKERKQQSVEGSPHTGTQTVYQTPPDPACKTPDQVLSSLTPIQLAVLEAIPDDRAVTMDSLGSLGYAYGDTIAALTMLEILGLVQKLPGALYTKS